MPKEKLSEFRLRLSPDLKAIIEKVRGSKSINRQINEWLWSRAQPDEAERLVDALRPLLASLDEEDRERFVDRAVEAVEVLAKGSARRRQRRK